MAQQAPGKVLVVGGTHGNERNATWLVELWRRRLGTLRRHGLVVELVIGNPAAHAAGRRYIERDLNRSFDPSLLAGCCCEYSAAAVCCHYFYCY